MLMVKCTEVLYARSLSTGANASTQFWSWKIAPNQPLNHSCPEGTAGTEFLKVVVDPFLGHM